MSLAIKILFKPGSPIIPNSGALKNAAQRFSELKAFTIFASKNQWLTYFVLKLRPISAQ